MRQTKQKSAPGAPLAQTWNPEQYEKFKSQRAQPFFDLLALVQPVSIERAVDLGCGTGELTRELFKTHKIKSLVGIDSSPDMLQKSQAFAGDGLSFQKENIGEFAPPEKFDLVFSNAALQWLPNHEALIPRVLSWVKAGGQVAIQMPYNFDHPSHLLAAEVAKEIRPDHYSHVGVNRGMLTLERYAEILFENGFVEQNCRIQVYGHPMASGRDVVEWTKGTLLTGYQAKLTPVEFAEFLSRYEQRLVAQLGEGAYFYAFKRLLLWGRRSSR